MAVILPGIISRPVFPRAENGKTKETRNGTFRFPINQSPPSPPRRSTPVAGGVGGGEHRCLSRGETDNSVYTGKNNGKKVSEPSPKGLQITFSILSKSFELLCQRWPRARKCFHSNTTSIWREGRKSRREAAAAADLLPSVSQNGPFNSEKNI